MSEQQKQKSSINFSRFADWCWHFNSISEEARHTVEILLKIARTSDINKVHQILSLQKVLDLSDNQISDLMPLQFLTHLTHLNLSCNQISDIIPLQSLTNLVYLNLSYNQISDISHLNFLTDLTRLDLSQNQISDIAPLQSLTNLNGLFLKNNQISDITPLQFLTNLKELNLDWNQISNITSLQSLTDLKFLYLDNNRISDIKSLQSLNSLISLSLNFDISENCTPGQKALIETCRHYWISFANSTKPIDRVKASNSLKAICDLLGLSVPEIFFCSSPHQVLARLEMQPYNQELYFIDLLNKQVENSLSPFTLITDLEWNFLADNSWENQLKHLLIMDFCAESFDYFTYINSIVTPKYLVKALGVAKFCVSVLGIEFQHDSQKLFETIEQILTECGWIFTFKNVCYICDRPIKLSLDSEYRLHAAGESAIEFADGYKLYSHHGVTLPEKYGAVHPKNWQAEWILSENNAELRRILIQEIGYARICQELAATELDSYQEYTLLRIDADIDGFDPEDFEDDDGAPEKEPIHLLKMTCPSTGFIHALRVPPDLTSAREAIRWVNWDIAPEDFSVQT